MESFRYSSSCPSYAHSTGKLMNFLSVLRLLSVANLSRISLPPMTASLVTGSSSLATTTPRSMDDTQSLICGHLHFIRFIQLAIMTNDQQVMKNFVGATDSAVPCSQMISIVKMLQPELKSHRDRVRKLLQENEPSS